jgi:hypothetical protein
MRKITEFIARETRGESFKTNKYSLDSQLTPVMEYDGRKDATPYDYGETAKHKPAIDISDRAKQIHGNPPLFKYFLDGSRRTYRVDDIKYGQKVFPIVAGQIGVGCCVRENKKMRTSLLKMCNVIVVPESADKDGGYTKEYTENYFCKLKNDICALPLLKKRKVEIHDVLYYGETIKKDETYEDKGIAKIQDTMIEKEKYVVEHLTKSKLLNGNAYLLKDGSLEYKDMKEGDYKELAKIKNNYNYCIGASKTFNAEKFRDINGKSNAGAVAELKLFHRTSAYLFKSEISGDVPFAVWYVRIRDKKYSYSPFDGILKLEKILTSGDGQKLDSDLIDFITANIINERNPVCYGADTRWANHLYPVYLTETFIKSKYLSSEYFLNLF